MEKVVVFLGGTCNGSTWRDELIPMLEVSFFNPVVPDWNGEAYERNLYMVGLFGNWSYGDILQKKEKI